MENKYKVGDIVYVVPWLKDKKGCFVGRCYVIHMMTDIGDSPMVIEYAFPRKNIYRLQTRQGCFFSEEMLYQKQHYDSTVRTGNPLPKL